VHLALENVFVVQVPKREWEKRVNDSSDIMKSFRKE
jgi:hypothetical protein